MRQSLRVRRRGHQRGVHPARSFARRALVLEQESHRLPGRCFLAPPGASHPTQPQAGGPMVAVRLRRRSSSATRRLARWRSTVASGGAGATISLALGRSHFAAQTSVSLENAQLLPRHPGQPPASRHHPRERPGGPGRRQRRHDRRPLQHRRRRCSSACRPIPGHCRRLPADDVVSILPGRQAGSTRGRFPLVRASRGERVYPHEVEVLLPTGWLTDCPEQSHRRSTTRKGRDPAALASARSWISRSSKQLRLASSRRAAARPRKPTSARPASSPPPATTSARLPTRSRCWPSYCRTAGSPSMAAEIPQLAEELRQRDPALVTLVSNVTGRSRGFDTDKLPRAATIDRISPRPSARRRSPTGPAAGARRKRSCRSMSSLHREGLWPAPDRIKLGRVLGNLLGNAIKVHRPRQHSPYHATRRRRRWRWRRWQRTTERRRAPAVTVSHIAVSDTGIGITPDNCSPTSSMSSGSFPIRSAQRGFWPGAVDFKAADGGDGADDSRRTLRSPKEALSQSRCFGRVNRAPPRSGQSHRGEQYMNIQELRVNQGEASAAKAIRTSCARDSREEPRRRCCVIGIAFGGQAEAILDQTSATGIARRGRIRAAARCRGEQSDAAAAAAAAAARVGAAQSDRCPEFENLFLVHDGPPVASFRAAAT